jgi:hypothetical protein
MAIAKGYSREDLQNAGRSNGLLKSAADYLSQQHLGHLRPKCVCTRVLESELSDFPA